MPKNDATIDELQTRISKFLLYDRILDNSNGITIGFVLLTVAVGYFTTSLMRTEFSSTLVLFCSALGAGFMIAVVLLLVRKRREYLVESNEWALFYTHIIYTNLQSYFQTNSLGMKKNFRKKALENARRFLSCIDKRWTVGLFNLSIRFFGEPISNLKRNLRYGVIPAIEDGNEESLKKVKEIILGFYESSGSLFSIGKLNEINTAISAKLTIIEPPKKGYVARGARFLVVHGIARHSCVLAVFGVSSSILGYVFWTYGVSIDNAWLGGIAIFGILTGIYYSRQPK